MDYPKDVSIKQDGMILFKLIFAGKFCENKDIMRFINFRFVMIQSQHLILYSGLYFIE